MTNNCAKKNLLYWKKSFTYIYKDSVYVGMFFLARQLDEQECYAMSCICVPVVALSYNARMLSQKIVHSSTYYSNMLCCLPNLDMLFWYCENRERLNLCQTWLFLKSPVAVVVLAQCFLGGSCVTSSLKSEWSSLMHNHATTWIPISITWQVWITERLNILACHSDMFALRCCWDLVAMEKQGSLFLLLVKLLIMFYRVHHNCYHTLGSVIVPLIF